MLSHRPGLILATTLLLVCATTPPATRGGGMAGSSEASADIPELRFNEFFRFPVGPRGLEFSEKLRSLDGKRVRIVGHMVNHVHANPRVFLLSPVPLRFHQCEYGLCDDLPAAALHVYVPNAAGPNAARERVPFQPGLLELTGRLSVGNHEELDGRVSTVRLHLDAPAAPAPGATATTR